MGYTAHTAPGVEFETREELLAHYKSEWHTFNLKRKAAGLPLLSKELFEAMKARIDSSDGSELSAGKDDHHKQTERAATRRMKKAALQQHRTMGSEEGDEDEGTIVSESGDDEDAEWEELDPAEAEATLAQLELREHEQPPEDADSDNELDEDEIERKVMERLENNEGPVGLTSAGQELIVAQPDGSSKILGSRSFAHLYRQRHRPVDDRESTESAKHNQVQRRQAAGSTQTSCSLKSGTRPSEASVQEQKAKRRHLGLKDSTRRCRTHNKRLNLPQNVPH